MVNIAKYKKEIDSNEWFLTNFTMDQVEGRLSYLEEEIKTFYELKKMLKKFIDKYYDIYIPDDIQECEFKQDLDYIRGKLE